MQQRVSSSIWRATPLKAVLSGALLAGLVLCVWQVAAAPQSPRAQAEKIVEALAGGSHADVVREPVSRTSATLKRADEAREAKRASDALLLEDYALEWAQLGSELIEAHRLEQQASALEQRLGEARTRLSRAEALLEETEARKGRARAQVLQLDPEVEAELPLTGKSKANPDPVKPEAAKPEATQPSQSAPAATGGEP